jgi:putative spermidine/putrescine transport system permease protein
MKKLDAMFVGLLSLTLALLLFLFIPVVLSMLAGITVNFQEGLSSGLTLKWLGQVYDLYADSIVLSVVVAAACLATVLVLGVPAAYAFSRSRSRFLSALEDVLLLPVAIPGLASALGLLFAYSSWTEFRSSWVFIAVGHAIFTLPFLIRPVRAVLSSQDVQSQEETAAMLGAGLIVRFFTIVIPAARSGIISGALMVLALSFGEFNLTWMLHTPYTKTLPVGLADSYASMRLEVASAYTLVFFVLIVPLLVALQALGTPKPQEDMKT